MGSQGQNAGSALTALAMAACVGLALTSHALAQTKWFTGGYICPTPKLNLDACTFATATVKVVIAGSAVDDIGRGFLMVHLEGGKIGYLSETIDSRSLLDEDPAITAARERHNESIQAAKRKKQEQTAALARDKEIEARRADCAARGQPKVGMTPAQATETCWRQPRRIVKKTTSTGVSEDYIYSIGHILRFQDGLLSEVIETR